MLSDEKQAWSNFQTNFSSEICQIQINFLGIFCFANTSAHHEHGLKFSSHLHGRDDLSLRFLHCDPGLGLPGANADHVGERDRFYKRPQVWLDSEFNSSDPPDYLVMFDTMVGRVGPFITLNGYENCGEFFHSHFPEGQVGRRVMLFCGPKVKNKR